MAKKEVVSITVSDIVQMITPIVMKSPVRRVILYGSYAKGTNTPESDVDLVIDSRGELKGIDFFVLSAEIAKALPIKSDIFEYREIKPNSAMYNEIARDGVVNYAS